MVITHNMTAMNSNRMLSNLSNRISKNSEKLSSGYRINRSADDAAGLSISEKMRSQIRGLDKATRNAEDGISFIQVAEGALNETHAILQRCKELTTQGANDTNVDADRTAIQQEIDMLMEELDDLSNQTKFNTLDVFLNDGVSNVSPKNGKSNEICINVEWSLVDASGNPVSVAESKAVGKDTNYANSAFAKFIEKAATDAVASLYDKFGSSLFTTSSPNIKIGLNLATIDGAGGVLASAALSMSASSTYTTMSYTMNVDKADYDAADFANMTEAEKADLAATVAHEMTHLVMFDTLTDGMLGGADSFPSWFVEGMAQTASGDGGWVSYQISSSSSDAQIKSYMSKLLTMPYGAGYLGTMYLGYAAGSPSGDLETRITDGLNKIFTSLTSGKSLDEAINENTSYSGLSAFESGFKGADTNSLNFVKDLLAARGANGAGSLLTGGLNVSQTAGFAESTLTDRGSNYVIKSDNTKYMNAFGTGYTFPDKPSGIAGESEDLLLQVGALEGQNISIQRYDVSATALLGGKSLDVSTHELAGSSMTAVDEAIERVSSIRSYYGAMQNRLEKTISNLGYTKENVQQSESRIRDTNMAEEMVDFSKHNILLQAAQSMLAQVNQSTQGVVSLLQ